MFIQLLSTLGYLALLAGIGFVVFRPRWMQRHVLPFFLVLVLQILFPFYFVLRLPEGWISADGLGVVFPVAMFIVCLVMMVVQGGVAAWIARRHEDRISDRPSYILLAAVHNAGFIPLPILERLAPDTIIVGMFFYLLAFNLSFWAVAVPIIRTGRIDMRKVRVRLNPPLVGMAIGALLLVTGIYRMIPPRAVAIGKSIGGLALDGALVALGGALASIREPLRFRREHWGFAAWRMVAYPAVMVALSAVPWLWPSGSLGWGLRLAVVLQATMPPATQTMVVTRQIGTAKQLHYTGGMILFAYLVSLVTIPLFVGATVALIGPGYG